MEQKLSDLLLIVLGVIIILSLLIYVILPFLGESGNKALCKNWVNMQSSTKVAGVKTLGMFESPCITSFDEIKTKDKYKINKQLAGDMYDCWDMYGAGKLDFYSDWDFGKSDTYCLVCKEIQVEKGIDTEINIDDFEEYLSNYNPPNHKENYAEYFLGPDHSSIDFGTGTIKLNNENPLYTLFVVNKKGVTGPTTIEENMGIASSCLALGVGGAQVGTVFPGIGNLVGFAGGCIIGIIGSSVFLETTHKESLYSSIFLASGKEVLEKGCDEVYYKPQKKIGDII